MLGRLFMVSLMVCSSGGAVGQKAGVPPAAMDPAAAAYAKLPVCKLDQHDATRLAVEPCRTAPQRMPPRRAVAQQLMPLPEAPPLSGGGPAPAPATRAGGPPGTPPGMPAAQPDGMAPARPTPAGTCDRGGCFDMNGVRHNGGAGKVTIDPSGKTCTRNGAWLQCF